MKPFKIWTFPLLLPRKPCFTKSTAPINSKGFSELHMDTKDFIRFSVISKDVLDLHYALDILGSRLIKINEKWPPGFKEFVMVGMDNGDSQNIC